MFKKVFGTKKFIFIFTFFVELIFYFFFEHLLIGGEYLLPDIGLTPIFGLMFGPVGGLGHAFASFICQIYGGVDIVSAFIDFSIMFFISILTYKLWYSIFKKRGINTPKFDSLYNILKFISIMFIVSIIYWTFINISLEAYPLFSLVYPLTNHLDLSSYALNMFNFSIIFGLLFISVSNILQIPLQAPKKWFNIINIDYKYFLLSFIILLIYLVLAITSIIDNQVINSIFFIMADIIAILFCVNKFDVNIKIENITYSIIEEIILIFLIILAITLFVFFNYFVILTIIVTDILNDDFLMISSLAGGIVLVVMLSLIHIYFIEKNLTNPIYDLIDVLKHYQNNNKSNNEIEFESKFKTYLESNNAISTLFKSFFSLNKNINLNLNKLKKVTAEKERIETEFNIASNIQASMLRTDFNEFSKDKPFEIYGFMSPAREVGGDFYDFFNMDDEHILFLVGDVSGKGVPATLFMVKTMHSIRNHSKFNSNPQKIYENVNNLSCQRNDEELFVTSWVGKLNLKNGNLSFVNAGHNQPLIKTTKTDNYFEYLNIRPNLVLGGMENIHYKKHELKLNPGEVLFLYTDGVTEANNNYDGFYGEDRLKEIINKYKDSNLELIVQKIKEDIYEFCDGESQFDDVTMLIIKYTGCDDA